VDKPVHNYVDKLWISPVKLVDTLQKSVGYMWDIVGYSVLLVFDQTHQFISEG
jgi:hypothetical protein